ncbi:MAG: hypothetical protein K2G89_02560 [Lachnospiraceae bacterium]|nr:hypothetical protein [Lachnospiraceae bacterium]
MSGGQIALIVIVVALLILAVLYFVGNKLQKKQAEQREQMAAAAQPCTMMIIDKKMMKMSEANLPKAVVDQTPKRMRNMKLPIVKAKIGPQITNLICDDGIFDDLPVRGEVKAMLSGIYIVSVKNIRGKVEKPQGKQSFTQKMRSKQRQYEKELAEEEQRQAAKKAAKKSKKK